MIRLLASEIGPRRPCSCRRAARRRGAGRLAEGASGGSAARGAPRILHVRRAIRPDLRGGAGRRPPGDQTAALGASACRRRGPARSDGGRPALHAGVASASRGSPTANLVASIPAAREPRGRVCLVGHMDSTRYGLMFHPAAVRRLHAADRSLPFASRAGPGRCPAAAAAARTAKRLRGRAGRARLRPASCWPSAELRGEDVPGASDNASGAAVAAALAAECAVRPLERTQVDLLITSCEESGLLGRTGVCSRAALA